MNAVMMPILTELLQNDYFWDAALTKIDYSKLCFALENLRPQVFFDTVWYAKINERVAEYKDRLPISEQEEHFEWVPDLWDNGCGGWSVSPCEQGCEIETDVENIYYDMDDEVDQALNEMDWGWEIPSEGELYALGIKPKLVSEITDKKGNVQLSMFT